MEDIRYNLIAEVLEKRKKTAYWLSTVLSVSPATATRWANNQSQPPLPVLFEIAAALKVEARTLLVKNDELKKQLPGRFAEIEEKRDEFPKKRGRKPKE